MDLAYAMYCNYATCWLMHCGSVAVVKVASVALHTALLWGCNSIPFLSCLQSFLSLKKLLIVLLQQLRMLLEQKLRLL